jgi:DNA repair protein RadA/Sms
VTVPLIDIDHSSAVPIPTGLTEVDRVLGGGIVAGSVALLSGEPGIGKSTLSLQIVQSVASSGGAVLLVTGEEAPSQVAGRAGRLGSIADTVSVLDVVDVHAVTAAIAELSPQLVVVDSIQTMHDPDLDGAPGSVSQVRQVAAHLVAAAKRHSATVILIGHVTKDGSLAGPRQLEHVVDTVLSFEGDRASDLRRLRAVKHRFGTTSEVGLFEMSFAGLHPVLDPSARFLADRLVDVPGSVVVPILDGHRPVMIEVQALVRPRSDAAPQRTAHGLTGARLKLSIAVLAGRAEIDLGGFDVFASVAGGVKTDDPAIDLGLSLALASAALGRALAPSMVAIGEVGLAGEIRSVPRLDLRLQEAYRVGYRRAVVPQSAPVGPAGLELVRCQRLDQAVGVVGGVGV